LKVIFVDICGYDLFGRFMLDALLAHGIDTIPNKGIRGY